MQELSEVAQNTDYSYEAFLFLQRGLDYTVRRIHGDIDLHEDIHESDMTNRHVSGRDLCEGLRDYAKEQYGLLAQTVLRSWNIKSCSDFGRMVFAMVESGMMQKTEDDDISDFEDVYEFGDAFTQEELLLSDR